MANLFTSQTPGLPDVDEASAVTVGTIVYFTTAGTVTGGRFYAPLNVGASTYSLAFWQLTSATTGTLLASSNNFSSVTAGAWNGISFTSSASVSTGVYYCIGLRSGIGKYTATATGFQSSAITNGSIVGPQTGTNPAGPFTVNNGVFTSGVTNFPSSTFNGNLYFVDVEFAVAADVTAPTVPTGLATTAIGATTASFSWTASTDNVGVTGYELQVIGP